ncbi:TspO/MBR family protein [Paracoccus benzoatiresistens]|uniref:Tryptophan-rich sensory protein n=1 Tax=Paracoccus benzoatiresistens TaxID=2997341 RepID=A0ABT4J141_9RHOB|nr:TspO/MBR family protein [Paracoccus sp. EF6]MCZ0960609.1 tryptophan-rich sensory protein [Paracoccus sp. EF6]
MHRLLPVLVLLAALAFAVSPLLSNGFGGYRPDQFPIPQTDPPIQPAGWAFSIWGLIFAWLVAGSGFGAWKRAGDPDWQPMRPALLVSLVLGAFWIETAHRTPIGATVLIVAMLVPAVAAFLRAGRRDPVWQVRPVALYAGWLTAATGASFGMVLGGHGILSEQAAAILCLLGVTAVAVLVQSRRPAEWAYPAGVVWALVGIFAANLSPVNPPVLALSGLAALLLAYRAAASLRANPR